MSRAIVVIHGPADRQRISKWAQNVKEGTIVEFRQKRRSADQNALLWCWLGEISRQVDWYGTKLAADDWKDVFTAALRQARVVPGINAGSFVPLGMRTSDMTTDEFSQLLELMAAFAAERGVVLTSEPDTNEAAGTVPDRQEAPGDNSPASEPSQEDTGTPLHTMLSALRTDEIDPDAPAGQHEDAITPAPERLVSYARDMMAIAGGDGDAGLKKDRLGKAHARWRDDIAKLAPEEQERAKSVLLSAQMVAKGEADHADAVAFFADVMGVETAMLREAVDA